MNPLDRIASALRAQQEADERLRRAVAAARAAGHSWEAIAQVLGVTRQTAHERFRQE